MFIIKNFLRQLCVILMFSVGTQTLKAQKIDTLWMHQMDLTPVNDLFKAQKTQDKRPLLIAGKTYDMGIAAPEGLISLDLKGKALQFKGEVGMDDNVPKGAIRFVIYGDKNILFSSVLIRKGNRPVKFDVNLKNVSKLHLIVENDGDGIHTDHADWVNSFITYRMDKPDVMPMSMPKPYILTPKESPKPKINGARVYGARPGHPFLYLIAATGTRPMKFSATNLPKGLVLDPKTGIISGSLSTAGETVVKVTATNALGTNKRDLKIVGGDKLSLTPAMGWNSWNCFADAVDADKVKAATDAMINSGLTNHGWSYVNIDDCWSMKPGSKDSLLSGPPRDANGMINSNGKFKDMNGLTDYIHKKGLKAGIYSSPGSTTCGVYTSSYGYEEQDAKRWGDWGFDYIKYDWCSYYKVFETKDSTLAELQLPYRQLGNALKKVDRDIVYSLCQYGMGDVGKWGREVGAQSWRISRDVHDTWTSMSGIGFAQSGKEVNASPGHWNDADMLVIGMVGWGPKLRPTRLTPDEQYSHVSLWALLTSPLLIGCDMTRMDDFTKNLLTNDEVIDINQDPLGKQASRKLVKGKLEVWVKDLEDGSKAIGLFNRSIFPETMQLKWKELGLEDKYLVRDAWRQKDLGIANSSFTAELPPHGVKLIVVRKAK